MAIDARIPLGVQSSGIGDLVLNFANDMERSKLAQAQNERQDKLLGLQKDNLQFQREKAQAELEKAGMLERAKKQAAFTLRLHGTKDPAQRAALMDARDQELTQLGLPNDDLQRWRTMPPEALESELVNELRVAGAMGVLDVPQQYQTAEDNGTKYLVDPVSGDMKRHPTAQTPQEKVLGDLAVSQRQAAIAAANDRREAARTAAEQREFELQKAREDRARSESERKQSLVDELQDKRSAYESATFNSDKLAQNIEYAKELVNWKSTGIVGKTMRLFGANDASDLGAILEGFKGQNAFAALAELAERGIKLTPISNDEVKLAASTVAALDPNASVEHLKRSLNQMQDFHRRITRQSKVGLARTMKRLSKLVPPEELEAAQRTLDTGADGSDDELQMLQKQLEDLQRAASQ